MNRNTLHPLGKPRHLHLLPEAALEALADQNIPHTAPGKTICEQRMAAVRVSNRKAERAARESDTMLQCQSSRQLAHRLWQ